MASKTPYRHLNIPPIPLSLLGQFKYGPKENELDKTVCDRCSVWEIIEFFVQLCQFSGAEIFFVI